MFGHDRISTQAGERVNTGSGSQSQAGETRREPRTGATSLRSNIPTGVLSTPSPLKAREDPENGRRAPLDFKRDASHRYIGLYTSDMSKTRGFHSRLI
eukprot:5470616-Pyramimonas_sp.AAC.1